MHSQIYFYHKFKLKFRRFPERGNLILWNHFYSWGPMFAKYQHIAYSFGTHIVGNWFVALQCMIFHKFFKCLWGRKFMGKCNLCPRNQRTLIPPNNDDPTVSITQVEPDRYQCSDVSLQVPGHGGTDQVQLGACRRPAVHCDTTVYLS